MYHLEQSDEFKYWFAGLRDSSIKNRLLARFARVENGNFGDHKTIGGELCELRMTFGGGMRVYYTQRGDTVVLLLNGGNKASQARDIEKARQLMADLEG